MENRYDILAKAGQRNIADYNKKVKAGKFKDDKDMVHRPMPYIVVVIDEFADLILTASKEIEGPIVRLAQMARAVGIHLIIATQRPSVNVITGIIKANFPARIAYMVSSKVDSRTILDVGGAETLLGSGDMLYLPPDANAPLRVQGCFVSGIAAEDRDPLFEEAARLVIGTQQGSVSMVQRRLKVGYARAGRIIDELEDAGIVGPFDGSKARQVLMESEAELEAVL